MMMEPVPKEGEDESGIGCVSFFTRRIVLPALLLLLGGCILLIPAFLLLNKPTIGPTLVVVALGLIFMSIILMYSELRRLRMERSVRLNLANGTQDITTGAADFLRGGPRIEAPQVPLNPYHPADPRYEEFQQQNQHLKRPSVH